MAFSQTSKRLKKKIVCLLVMCYWEVYPVMSVPSPWLMWIRRSPSRLQHKINSDKYGSFSITKHYNIVIPLSSIAQSAGNIFLYRSSSTGSVLENILPVELGVYFQTLPVELVVYWKNSPICQKNTENKLFQYCSPRKDNTWRGSYSSAQLDQ